MTRLDASRLRGAPGGPAPLPEAAPASGPAQSATAAPRPPSEPPPLASAAAQAERRLGSAALAVVFAGLGQQLDGIERLLAPPSASPAQAARAGTRPSEAKLTAHVRTIERQLASLRPEQLGAEDRAVLTRASDVVTTLLERSALPKGALDKLDGQLGRLLAPSVLAELERTGGPRAARDAALAVHPERDATLASLARLYPAARGAEARKALSADLGPLEGAMRGHLADAGVPKADVERFFGAMADVREGFRAGAARGDDMQRTNWVHTRIEVLHTLEAARALGLPADQALAAAVGSLASDAFKDGSVHSLLWHNRGGGELVAPLLVARHFPAGEPRTLLDDARGVALDHQITPALFMAGAMRGRLGAKADTPAGQEILSKVGDPLAHPAKDGELTFSPEAKALLAEAGLPGWTAPSPADRRHGASMAAIVGDVLQYVNPDGILKIAVDIRDPEQAAPFMRDATIHQAIASSTGFSFGEGMKVVKDPALVAEGARAKQALEGLLEQRVKPEVERRLRATLGVPDGAPTPPIPYWNQPVPTAPPEGAAPGARILDPGLRAQVDDVKRTFGAVLAELGGVPTDPFGHRAARDGGVR
jgi:hypothetical protein